MDFNELPFLSKAILSAQPLEGKTDAQIVEALNAPYRFSPMSYNDFVTAVKAAGATWLDLKALSKADALVINLLTDALAQGDLAVVLDAVEGAKTLMTNPSDGLKTAIDKVVQARTLTRYTLAKISFATGAEDEVVPETATEGGVAIARSAAEAHIVAKKAEIDGLLASSATREAEANRKLEEDRAIEALRLAELQAKADADRAEALQKVADQAEQTEQPA